MAGSQGSVESDWLAPIGDRVPVCYFKVANDLVRATDFWTGLVLVLLKLRMVGFARVRRIPFLRSFSVLPEAKAMLNPTVGLSIGAIALASGSTERANSIQGVQ